ncbi:MAG: 3'(2'),5'-bisphosphate nucleotidase CysQ [Thiotrichales bacterium]|nr:3'(2'),5'-bisphosphate nucleotidase CysQ [Thiotrichales bacterium]
MTESISHTQLQQWLPQVCLIALQAGRGISQMYREHCAHQGLAVERKGDGTPVTQADRDADELIYRALQAMTPEIPLVTEESVAQFAFAERQDWHTYWLVDPLDGTKEFIEATGEYSVNIALIINHQPVLGVVFGPEVGKLYFALRGEAAYGLTIAVQQLDLEHLSMPSLLAQAQPIHSAKMQPNQLTKVAVSRHHGGRTQHFMSQLGACETIKMGSALKACLVAEGAAHVYPRFGPTSLWDTAASQVIVEMAGGAMLNAAKHPLEYVQTPSLLNPSFMVVCQSDYAWPPIPEVL